VLRYPLETEWKKLHNSKDAEETSQQGSNGNKTGSTHLFLTILFLDREGAKCLKEEGKMSLNITVVPWSQAF
jgi:hypothetical protein